MTVELSSPPPQKRLGAQSLSLGHIVFFVVAAAAPLTAVVGTAPAAFAFGNGAGVPGAFVLAGLLYLFFSAGFTAMSRYVAGAGGFYVYLTQGLGGMVGLGGALLALVTYSSIQLAIYALLGVFAASALTPLGLVLPWYAWSGLAMAFVFACGQRNITLSGHILGACMIAEIVILCLLDFAILHHGGGPSGISFSSFSPAAVLSPGLGVAMVFVVGSYVGFESTAIFGEEAKDSHKTIARATYIAVVLITAFYAFSTWAIVQYYGTGAIKGVAAAQPEEMFFLAAEALLGHWSVACMNVLLIVSLLACTLSLHSTISRYLYALGREGMIWRHLGSVHVRHGSPHVAGTVQSILAVLSLAPFVMAKVDPYTVVFAWMSAFAVLGILIVQALVSVAIIVFFARRRDLPESRLSTLVCPAIAFVALGAVIALVIHNLPLLTGSDTLVVDLFPALLIVILLAGMAFAAVLRRRDPTRYALLGQSMAQAA